MSSSAPCILYCHCQYAQVVPRETKEAVLRQLCESGVAFEAVADLCEMAARRDPALQTLAQAGAVKIAACFPRAVKGLFHQAGADLPLDRTEVLNMRTQSAAEVCTALLSPEVTPNVPTAKFTASSTAETPADASAAVSYSPAPPNAPTRWAAPAAPQLSVTASPPADLRTG